MIAQEIGSFFIVLAVAVCVAGAIGALYATGLRLWMGGVHAGSSGAGTAAPATSGQAGQSMTPRRIGAIACFAACVAIVLVALWLMIPMFH